MKNLLKLRLVVPMARKLLIASIMVIGFISPVRSIEIVGGIYDGTDVGKVDELINQTNSLANSGINTELNWVNPLLGSDYGDSNASKTEDVVYYATINDEGKTSDDTGIFAFALNAEYDYYIIKNSTFWALFKNEGNLDWAVFNINALNPGFNLGQGDSSEWTISHVTGVSEPLSLTLLAIVLAGVGFSRRMARK